MKLKYFALLLVFEGNTKLQQLWNCQKKLNLSGIDYKNYQITTHFKNKVLKEVSIKNELWILEKSYACELMCMYTEL